MRFSQFLPLAPLCLAQPTHNGNQLQSRSTGVQWGRCYDPQLANTTLQCGNLKVPLDYTEPNCTDIRLDIIKAPATKKPSKGSIFFNFGGPGASGAADLLAFYSRIQAATGPEYDIVNVVPRGTNDTLAFSCYSDVASRTFGSEIVASDAWDGALGTMWAKATLFAANCGAVMNETGQYIGTAFTARDIMQVVDAIEPDGMLRYWGVSYGTLLGSTLAALFPDKVDRMVLDGVVNPHEYYQNREVQLWDDADGAFRGFIEGCAANPKLCPFAKNQSADQIEDLMIEFLETLKSNPLAIPIPGTPGGGVIIDYSIVKAYINTQLYWPNQWPALATLLSAVMTGDVELIIEVFYGGAPSAASAATFVPQDQEARFGIKCGDVLDSGKSDNLTELMPFFERRHAESRFFGAVADETPARCAQWALPAKERYDGDFKVKTKTGMLVIGNSFDPVAPLSSARNVSETFEGAALLHQDGAYGHTTFAQISLCTAKTIRSYFSDATLPEHGAKCQVDIPFFTDQTGWESVLKQLGSQT